MLLKKDNHVKLISNDPLTMISSIMECSISKNDTLQQHVESCIKMFMKAKQNHPSFPLKIDHDTCGCFSFPCTIGWTYGQVGSGGGGWRRKAASYICYKEMRLIIH